MLRSAPVVTLVGPGGVGKTRLAQRLARQVEKVFPDGVVMVELAAGQDTRALSSTVASALGVDPQGIAPDVAIAAYLRTRRVLLVLDNCEHLVEAAADLLRGLLPDTPQLRVLATSRQALGLEEEHVMTVEALGVPTTEEAASGRIRHVESVALLVDRARAVDPGFHLDRGNAEAVATLCRALDGIPLAIELAAPRLRHLSLTQLLDRLDDPLGLLTTGPRGAPRRHQTLRAVLDWSHDLCSPDEQALWARLSVFEGGADLTAVEAVCAQPGISTAEVLAALVDKSLVTVAQVDGDTRYRMLETIRDYGLGLLADRGETDLLRSRHRDHDLALAKEWRAAWFGPDQVALLTRVGADLGNMRACLRYSLDDEHTASTGLELASALAWYWVPAGAVDEGRRWFDRALRMEHAPSATLLRAWADATRLSIALLDLEEVGRLARHGAARPLADTTPTSRAVREWAEGVLAVVAEDIEGALSSSRAALAGFVADDDLIMQSETLFDIAVFLQVLERFDEARTVLEELLELCGVHGERFKRRFALEFHGYLQAHPQGPGQVIATLREVLTAWPIVQPVHVANTIYTLSKSLAVQGNYDAAAVLLGARVRIWQDFGVGQAPYEDVTFDDYGKRLSEAFGAAEFRASYDRGYAMSAEDAVRFAQGGGPADDARGNRDDLPLSKRERQVAALVAGGLTNKEIAEALVISPRTAEGHVAKVMDKLGVTSREQVAAWVAASGQE